MVAATRLLICEPLSDIDLVALDSTINIRLIVESFLAHKREPQQTEELRENKATARYEAGARQSKNMLKEGNGSMHFALREFSLANRS